MKKSLIVNAVINKRNGQINFSVPKKKISLSLKNKILNDKKMRIKIEDIL